MGQYQDYLAGLNPEVHLPLEELATDPVVNIGTATGAGTHDNVLAQQPSMIKRELFSMDYAIDTSVTQYVLDSPVQFRTLTLVIDLPEKNDSAEDIIAKFYNSADTVRASVIYYTNQGIHWLCRTATDVSVNFQIVTPDEITPGINYLTITFDEAANQRVIYWNTVITDSNITTIFNSLIDIVEISRRVPLNALITENSDDLVTENSDNLFNRA